MNGLSMAFNGQPANCGRSEKPLRFTWVRVVNHWTDRLWVLADIPLPLHFCDLKQFPLSWVVNHGQRIGNLRCFSATKIIIQISYWTRAPLQVIVSGRFVVNAFSASPGGANDGRFSKQTNKTNYWNVSASSRPVISFFFSKWKFPLIFEMTYLSRTRDQLLCCQVHTWVAHLDTTSVDTWVFQDKRWRCWPNVFIHVIIRDLVAQGIPPGAGWAFKSLQPSLHAV